MSSSKKTLKVKLSRTIVAQCRDRAQIEAISVSQLVKRAIAQYLTTPVNLSPQDLNESSVSTEDYARLVARVEQLEIQLAKMQLSVVNTASPMSNGSSASLTEDEGWEDADEPDEILYEFLEPLRPPA